MVCLGSINVVVFEPSLVLKRFSALSRQALLCHFAMGFSVYSRIEPGVTSGSSGDIFQFMGSSFGYHLTVLPDSLRMDVVLCPSFRRG